MVNTADFIEREPTSDSGVFWGFQRHLTVLTGVQVDNFSRIRPENIVDPNVSPVYDVNALGGVAIADKVVNEAWITYRQQG